MRFFLALVAAVTAMAASTAAQQAPDAATIIQRSTVAVDADYKAAPEYDHFERDREGGAVNTYHVMMILGSPYSELVAVNGQPLGEDDERAQQVKLNQEVARRRAETTQQHASRVAEYEKERRRDHRMLDQLTRAFSFKLLNERKLEHYRVYVLRATPKPGYQPPDLDSQVLPGMEGELWVDVKTFEWVKATAKVIHPVTIGGILARVEPGTQFELMRAPAAGGGVWQPSRFTMHSISEIFFFLSHRTQKDETYFDYQRSSEDPSNPTSGGAAPIP